MNAFKALTAVTLLAAVGDPTARAADPKTFLLTVSVSRCPKAANGFRPLDHADRAARKLHDTLLDGVPKPDRWAYFLSLAGEESNRPTTANVRAVLKVFAREATPADRVIVCMVGHGFENRDGAAFVTADAELDKPDTFLAVREVTERVSSLPCRERCVFVDACRDYRDDLPVTMPADAIDPNDAERRRLDLLGGSMVLVQSCSAGQYAYEKPDGAGLMTECLIEAFSGKADQNKDGDVSAREAIDYTRKAVRTDARTLHGKPQDVTDLSSGESFALVKLTDDRLPPADPTTEAIRVARAERPLGTRADPFGSPATGGQPARVEYGNGRGGSGFGNGTMATERPGLNAMVNGIPHNGAAGRALDFARQPTWGGGGGPGFRNPIPPQVQQYLPQPGVPLLNQLGRWIR